MSAQVLAKEGWNPGVLGIVAGRLLEESGVGFQQIVDLAISEKVDGVIIAGDLYDRAVPLWMRLSFLIRPWPASSGGADSCLCYQW